MTTPDRIVITVASPTPNVLRVVFAALLTSIVGMCLYVLIVALVHVSSGSINNNSETFYPPADFSDGKRYVKICSRGYDLPVLGPLVTAETALISWMPVYPALQCAIHQSAGVSLVFAGTYVSTLATGITLFFGSLTLWNLGRRSRVPYILAVLVQPIGALWLYVPGAESTYLAVGMVTLWLITLPPFADTARGRLLEIIRIAVSALIGVLLMLTKPNALALLIPITFAFFYLSWRRSQTAGYGFGLWAFVADVVIEHIRPLLAFFQRLRGQSFVLEERSIVYDWAPVATIAGILLGLAYWLVYTSWLSGIPFYFLQQQLFAWRRAWPTGNLGEAFLYFVQAFRGATRQTPWRVGAAYYLAANVSALIPAASSRVPTLIRGMLLLLPIFLLLSGAVNGDDRYTISTSIVVIGWACWLAPTKPRPFTVGLRLVFMSGLAWLTSYFVLFHLFAIYALGATSVVDR